MDRDWTSLFKIDKSMYKSMSTEILPNPVGETANNDACKMAPTNRNDKKVAVATNNDGTFNSFNIKDCSDK